MKDVPISVFKEKCFQILEEVRKTRTPVRITLRGKAIAEIVPPSPEKCAPRRLGGMVGTVKILGDVVGPTGSLDDWKAWRD